MDQRLKMISASLHKFYKRGAFKNIERIYKKSHPADIAMALASFPKTEQIKLVQLESHLGKRAEIISYLDEKIQKDVLSSLSVEEAQAVISEMESDDAADALSLLPEDAAQEILAGMDEEDSEDMTELMAYPEGSAGSLMSSDFLSVYEDWTVAQTIQKIQENYDELITFYIYVVNSQDKLLGVVSLKQLLLNRPKDLVAAAMVTDVISVRIDTPAEEAAKLVERYDLLSVPVVDHDNELMGIITVDDVIDVIRDESNEEILAMGRLNYDSTQSLQQAIRSRLPFLLLSMGGGFMGFVLLLMFRGRELAMSSGEFLSEGFIFFPVGFAVSAVASHQSSTACLHYLREIGESKRPNLWRKLLKELMVMVPILLLLWLVIFSLTVGVHFLGLGLGDSKQVGSGDHSELGAFWDLARLTSVVPLILFFAGLIGTLVPFGVRALKLDLMLLSNPASAFFVELALVLLFIFYV